ncbi:MAG: hypothetical protein JWR70_2944 [Modestobacter sp.]|jgi:hypothetical protein|nr:hypothetical protein [Modestobacter sp.]
MAASRVEPHLDELLDAHRRDADQGVGAETWPGAALVPVERVGAAEDRGALEEGADPDEEDADPDDEVVVDGAWDAESLEPVAVGVDGELSLLVVAGAVVVREEGVDGVVSRCEDTLVSSPRVVVPEECELPTSADTGFCPMSSIPVTTTMATAKTATA